MGKVDVYFMNFTIKHTICHGENKSGVQIPLASENDPFG